jgi:hypothetical protein
MEILEYLKGKFHLYAFCSTSSGYDSYHSYKVVWQAIDLLQAVVDAVGNTTMWQLNGNPGNRRPVVIVWLILRKSYARDMTKWWFLTLITDFLRMHISRKIVILGLKLKNYKNMNKNGNGYRFYYFYKNILMLTWRNSFLNSIQINNNYLHCELTSLQSVF